MVSTCSSVRGRITQSRALGAQTVRPVLAAAGEGSVWSLDLAGVLIFFVVLRLVGA